MKNIIIREARSRDTKQLLELRTEFAQLERKFDNSLEFNPETSRKLKKEILDSFKNDSTVFLVGEVNDGVIVGYITLHFYPDLPKVAYIGELFVAAPERRKGIGEDLVTKAFEWAKEKGVKEVKLRTYKDNSSAAKFFEKIGFNEEEIKTVLLSFKLSA